MPLDAANPSAWSLATPWIATALLIVGVAIAVAVWMAYLRVAQLERRLASLARLDELKIALDRLVTSHSDLDLRRLEHVLIDIRDGQRRVEDRLLSVIEGSRTSRATPGALELPQGDSPSALADRVVTRLLALGYERVQLVTPTSELAQLVAGDGEVLVEARRDGAPCKGRVSVRHGVLTDVQIQAAYSTFP